MDKRGPRRRNAAKPCPHCGGPHGPDYCLTADFGALAARRERYTVRAGAHAAEPLRAAQRWQHGVTDLDVASIMYAIEADAMEFHRIKGGRWVAPVLGRRLSVRDVSRVINEMIRTGLLRHVIDHGYDYLVPALVHLVDETVSACRFTGEDLGPMRARLVQPLDLVDCLECLATVGRGRPRGL